MYEIYINDHPLIITENEIPWWPEVDTAERIIAGYPLKTKFLYNYIDKLEKAPVPTAIILNTDNPKEAFKSFKESFKKIKAAGGLVTNDKNDLLLIWRRGYWDMAKGKLDNGETQKEAAVREVKEETGIKNLELGSHAGTTWHMYRLESGKRVLKKNKWYFMKSNDTDFVPEVSEDIEKVIWVPFNENQIRPMKIYNGLQSMLDKILKNYNKN
jgi:8-oxo-dGTP pyrophosphatase MutT (NUDIX family)